MRALVLLVAVAGCEEGSTRTAELEWSSIADAGDRLLLAAVANEGSVTDDSETSTIVLATMPVDGGGALTPLLRDSVEIRGRVPSVGGAPGRAYLTWSDDQ